MPRWLRQFTFNKINDFYKKESEEAEKSSKGSGKSTLIDSSGKINRENWGNVAKPITPTGKPTAKYK